MACVRWGKRRRGLPVGMRILGTGGPLPTSAALPNIPSPIAPQSDTRTCHTDFDGVAWARQPVSGSVDLVYLGGVAFSRERVEITQTFPTVLRIFTPGGGSFKSTIVSYG